MNGCQEASKNRVSIVFLHKSHYLASRRRTVYTSSRPLTPFQSRGGFSPRAAPEENARIWNLPEPWALYRESVCVDVSHDDDDERDKDKEM